MRIQGACPFLLALLPALTLSGCGGLTSGALQFNEKIVQGNQKLEKAGQEFGEALGAALQGGPTEIAEARRLYDVACQTLRTVQSDTRSLQVPSSQAARNLYAAYQRFLEGQERMVLQDMGEVMKLLEDSALNEQEKAQRIVPILTQIQTTETTDLATLKSLQQAFAKEYNIILE